MNKKNEFIEDLIQDIEFKDVPEEFIDGARVTSYSGDVTLMDCDEVFNLISDPENLERNDVASVALILNLEAIGDALDYYAEILLSSIPE